MKKLDTQNAIKELEKEISAMRNSLSTDHMDMSFGEIMGMYEREELIITPEFQRLYRWEPDQKTRFIESIILGIPIPPIFVAENKVGAWELVDGLQRISTVLSFFGVLRNQVAKTVNNWCFVEAGLLPSLEGLSAETLPKKYLLNLKRSVCRIEVIKWDSKWDMRYELFNRLNTGGTALNEQEIRNCIFRGGLKRFYAFIEEAKKNADFISLTSLSAKQKNRLFDEDLIVRFVSLVDDWRDVDSAMSVYATTYMKKLLDEKRDITQKTIDRFYACLRLLKPLGRDVFRVKNVFSASLFDSIMVGLSSCLPYYVESPTSLIEAVSSLKNSDEFKLLRGGASSKTRTRIRLELASHVFEDVASR